MLLTGNYWLDPYMFRIQFYLKKHQDDDEPLLYPLVGPWAFSLRLRVMAGNTTIDFIDSYKRIHEMFQMFRATASREMNTLKAFLIIVVLDLEIYENNRIG